jgi:hypothetical protein
LQGGKLFIKLTEPIKDVTVCKAKRKATTAKPPAAQKTMTDLIGLTEREIWQEFLDM